jgi:acetolactate synthase-1/2/3 large subunit
MNIQELATAVHEGLPVIVAILNNGYLGMVRQWQELFFDRRYSSVCLMRNSRCPRGCSTPGDQCPAYIPDFVKLAEAYSAVGLRVTAPAEVGPALEAARAVADRPVFIDFLVQREANVWPIVPAGKGIDQMLMDA